MSLAGSLTRHLFAWKTLSASVWILRLIEAGFRLPWEERPAPLRALPPAFKPPSSLEARQVLDQEVDSLLAKKAVEEVISPSPGFYGRIFCVPKRSGGFRPVLDLSALNSIQFNSRRFNQRKFRRIFANAATVS